jgi:hypothetical protein
VQSRRLLNAHTTPQEATIVTEHTDQPTVQSGAVPARIDLEDFIEAVARGVARARAAQDEVSGYGLYAIPKGAMVAGLVISCPSPPLDPRTPIVSRPLRGV